MLRKEGITNVKQERQISVFQPITERVTSLWQARSAVSLCCCTHNGFEAYTVRCMINLKKGNYNLALFHCKAQQHRIIPTRYQLHPYCI